MGTKSAKTKPKNAGEQSPARSPMALEFARHKILYHLQDFVASGLGVYAWRAFRVARKFGLPMPEIVLRYFDACAEALAEPAALPEVLAAMRLRDRSTAKGGGAYRKRVRDIDEQRAVLLYLVAENRKVAMRRGRERNDDRMTREALEATGAKFNRKPEAIRQLWMRWRKIEAALRREKL